MSFRFIPIIDVVTVGCKLFMNEEENGMDFNHSYRRADLNSIEAFLMHGGESFERPSDKSYAQRLQEARKNATAFFEARFTNIDEFDEIAGYFNEQVSVFEDVYLEIGLLLGARIAFQICGKIAELSDG